MIPVARWLARRPVTLGFSGLLAAGAVVLATRTPGDRASLLLWASTNIENLQHRPAEVLVLSAFLPENHAALWVVLALAGLGSAEARLGPARAAILAATGHLAGTAVSEGLLWYRVHEGALPVAERQIVDVGPSFVVVTGLLAAVFVATPPARVVATAGFAVLAPSLFQGITTLDVAPVGHACAVIIGAAGGWALLRSQRRTDQRRTDQRRADHQRADQQRADQQRADERPADEGRQASSSAGSV